MRNKRSAMVMATVSAVLLGASSLAQPHEVADPVEPVAASVHDRAASTVAQSPTTTEAQDATRSGSQSQTMENDPSRSASDPPRTTGTTGTSGPSSMERGSTSTSSMERDQSAKPTTTSRGAEAGGDVAWILMPVALQTQSDQMTKGCWVRLYSGDNFEGRHVTIAGPADIRELRSPYGTGLNNWESAEVGPNATVMTFDDEDFRARNATLRPGMRYAELDDTKLGLFEDIESLRVRCGSQAAGSSR